MLIYHHNSKQDRHTFGNENRREGACRIFFCRLDMTGTLKELCYGLSESRPWFYLIAHTLSEQRPEESSDVVVGQGEVVMLWFGFSSSLPRLFLPHSDMSFFPSLCPLTATFNHTTIARNQPKNTRRQSLEKDYLLPAGISARREVIAMIIDKHIDAGAGAGAAWTLRLSSYHPQAGG